MKIAIATDHCGVNEKNEIIKHFKEYEFIDKSPQNEPTDDYPDFAFAVGKSVANHEADYGIIICRTGIGMSIAANKVKGIRCAHVTSKHHAELTRIDNDSNVLAISFEQPLFELYEIIRTFIETPTSMEERHVRRRNKIISYENGEYNEL